MFITDRDLLAAEPMLFRDVLWTGQRLYKGSASTSAGVLTAAEGGLIAAGVQGGHVVVLDGGSYEVIERTDDTHLVVSRLRSETTDAAIPPPDASDRPAFIVTFAPQIAIIHRQILRMLDLEQGTAPVAPGLLSESAITNPRDLAPMEVFGSLYLILSAAAATAGPQSPLGIRAAFYRALFSQERGHALARLDRDGDGLADETRRLNIGFLRRA